jgi:hypothetical protein
VRLVSSPDNAKEFQMPSEGPEVDPGQVPLSPKTAWDKPAVTTFDAWEAEAQDGSGTDSGGFLS